MQSKIRIRNVSPNNCLDFPVFFIFNVVLILFFSLDRKEPKDQDYQKKSGNSTVRFTEILKLAPTPSGLRQSEFQAFCSPEFSLIFSKGR